MSGTTLPQTEWSGVEELPNTSRAASAPSLNSSSPTTGVVAGVSRVVKAPLPYRSSPPDRVAAT
jgi:hypothetical protein